MSLFKSKTDLWGRKTRPIPINEPPKVANGAHKEDDFKDDYLEEADKIMALEAKIEFLKSIIDSRADEIKCLQSQLAENNKFMQTVVLELIRLKTTVTTPVAAPVTVSPKTALEKYIEKKNGEVPKAKLP